MGTPDDDSARPEVDGNGSGDRPSAALARKLANVIALSASDIDVLDRLGWNWRKVAKHRDIVGDGDAPVSVQLILSGWACRYKVQTDGSRQITAILLPGDFCDLHITMLNAMDHGIAALSPVVVASVTRPALDTALNGSPQLRLAFDWMSLVDLSTLRAWMTSLGRSYTLSRVAHLLCELHQRTTNIGLADGASFPFPLTQIDIGDATGQTQVNANRVIRDLHHGKLATIGQQTATIHDVEALRRVAGFDPAYLHAQALVHR